MKNFTRLGRSLILALCFTSLFGGSLAAQSCNLNANNIMVSVNDVCDDSDPYVTVNLNNFFLDGEAVVRYEPVYNGFFQISGVDYTATVDFISGFGVFEIAEPRIPGFPNNFVRILEISFTGTCTQTFTGNQVVSNNYNFNGASDLTIGNLNTNDPPCPGVPTGTVQFFFDPDTPNGFGFNDFNRFQVRQQPFLSSAFTTLNPPGTGGNNTSEFEVFTQGLVSGTYVYLINDFQTGCETSYTVSIGGNFSVQAITTSEAGCFGESNGVVEISVLDADPSANGPIPYGLTGSNGVNRTGVITSSFASGSLAYDPVEEMNLPAGVYTIAIQTSAGGCSDQTGALVTELDEITVDPIDPIAVCADDATYTFTISGVENANRYRIRDAGNTGCWTNAGSLPLPAADANGVITITETLPSSCFSISEDSTVTVNLRLINNVDDPTCNVDFPFTVQVNAMPAAPVVDIYAIPAPGDTVSANFCSGQDLEVLVEDYDAAFTYELTLSGSSGPAIDTLGDFAGGSALYTGERSVIGSFVNNTDFGQTIDFTMIKTNTATGCVSDETDFSVFLRPLPVVDPLNVPSETICSGERWLSEEIYLNGDNNSNIEYNYRWVLNDPGLILTLPFTGSGESGDRVPAIFKNNTGTPLTATLMITPVFNQISPLLGGGSISNICEGAVQTIELTVSPEPILTYGLTIGDDATATLTSGDVLSVEICSGDDFSLENLMIAEDGSPKADYVEFRVNGDAGFLNITNTPFVTFLPTDNFSIGVEDIQNNNPNNNAQVAEIILTPYFEDGIGTPGADFPVCSGDPITLFLTVNPAVPQIADQSTIVCSGDRIEYQIAGASDMNGQLETRITGVETFEGTTDYVIPQGAARVDSFQFFLYGADGGGTTSSGFAGGRGAYLEGTLNDVQIQPGDTVRVREGLAGASNVTNGDGGDATILSVIRPGVGEVFIFVAGGGGGAGNAMDGETSGSSTLGGNGTSGIGPGGEPGTDLGDDALGGVGVNLGGGGGGGFAGGNGGDSPGGFAGGAGSSDVDGVGTAFVANKTAMDVNGDARIFFTIVYDDIRFNLEERIVAAGLMETTVPGQEIMNGEIDTILFGQQFENPTNEPLDVIYRFITNTEATCDDSGMVEVIVTVEPEPTGFLTSNGTTVAGDAANGYTATVCSGDGLDLILNSNVLPNSGDIDDVYFLVDTDEGSNVGFFGSGIHNTIGQLGLTANGIAFTETGITNNSGMNDTIVYTITPYINCIAVTVPDCEGPSFELTVVVQAGFSGVTNVMGTTCSDASLADGNFELATSQPGATNTFDSIRVIDFSVGTMSTDFEVVSSALPETLPLEGVLLVDSDDYFDNDVFSNRTGADVTVTYTVVFVSDQGCESLPVTYTFTINPEPIIVEPEMDFVVPSDSMLNYTIADSMNSAAVASVSYVADAEAGLTYVGPGISPDVTAGSRQELVADVWQNLTTTSLDVVYTVVYTSTDGCESDPVDFTFTIEPRVNLDVTATQGDNTVTGVVTGNGVTPDTLTICSGSAVVFNVDDLVDYNAEAYRINRLPGTGTGSTIQINDMPIDNVEGGLTDETFTETFSNSGSETGTVRYTFTGYTFGRNGMDDNGAISSDDARGDQKRLVIRILPAADSSTLQVDYFSPGNNGTYTYMGTNVATDTLCDATPVRFNVGTSLADGEAAFRFEQTNDGGLDGEVIFGDFSLFDNGNINFSQVNQVVSNPNASGVTYTYTFQSYTFGPNGIDDQMAVGSDDCPGVTREQTIYVEPVPTLTAEITVGSSTQTLMPSDEIQLFELCSGDDFSLGNLAFGTDDVPGRVKYVEFSIFGPGVSEEEFLDIDPTFGTPLDITGFLIGSQNVQNTSGDAYVAFINLTPYYEDDVNNTGLDNDCEGESIFISVILNPAVAGVPTPQDITVCSGEAVDFEIAGGANDLTSFTTGMHDFADGTDFVFPDNAAFVPLVTFTASSANGGASTNNGLSGAFGVKAEGDVSSFFSNDVIPGDTLRAVLGEVGADGTMAGAGGGGTALLVIGGPNRLGQEGTIIDQIVLGGGGGAGLLNPAVNNEVVSAGNSVPGDGINGSGPGGFAGLSAPSFAGGDNRNNGGGGAGGWIGGNGGDSFSGDAGESGTSFFGDDFSIDDFSVKSASDATGSSVTISYILALDDVVFTVIDKQVPTDISFDASMATLAIGDTGLDTLLNGELFVNDSDVPQTVTYVLSTTTETGCPGSTIDVNVTVEPNPTLDLASNGTMIMGDAENGYTATICSGDSLSAILSSVTMPTGSVNRVEAEVISTVISNPTDVSFTNTNSANASSGNNFGGVNEPAANAIPFYEGAINNVSDVAETVTYTVISLIDRGNQTDCFGDTITLTVTVNPGFDMVSIPSQFGLCSNVSLDDAGFDLQSTQPNIQIDFDSIMIDSVRFDPAMPGMNFETISSVYSGSPVMVTETGGFFGTDTYRNRTGGPVEVNYYVRLVSGPGCFSDEIVYNFRYTAEAVIDEVETTSNQIDTVVCDNQTIGLDVLLASNSAWFGNQGNVTYNIERVVPAGLDEEAGNATYPAMGVAANYFAADEYSNETNEPLTVTYEVTPINAGCFGDAVTYSATILPNPQAELTLISLDSMASFSLENSRAFLNPNPVFGVCSGQALDVVVTDQSSADAGVHMARVTISDLDNVIPTAAATINFLARVEDLDDSLSFAMGELVNVSNAPDTFTISYTTFFNLNGVPGQQTVVDGDCGSNGTVEFDVIVSQVNEARVDVRVTDDNIFTPIPTGMDTLCSGDLFDLAVRTASTTPNDPNLPAIDSFRVTVIAPDGMAAGAGTEGADFTVGAPFENPDFFFTRLDDLSWENTTPGIKTVTYIATPYSNGCAGVADTTTISYRPEVFLKLDVPAVCIAGEYAITAEDQNQAFSLADADYDWVYIGGAPGTTAADFFSIKRGDNPSVFEFVGPGNQAPLAFSDTRFLRIEAFANTTPGTADFEISYENDFGCTVTDTLTLTIGSEASAGTFDQNEPIQCESSSPIFLEDYLDGADPGGDWTQISGPAIGMLNGAAGSFLADDLNGGGALIEFGFRYLIGDGASGCTPDSTDIIVRVQSAISAGTYVGTPLEACDAAAPVNLFDALMGEESGGLFVQLSGTDNVFVDGADGIFDQSGVTPGTYTYRYEVAGRNGCPGDDETLVVEVLDMADCSEPVDCDIINLTAGFNVISFDVIPNDNSVEAVFADLIADQNLVQVVGVQANVNGGTPETFSYLEILDAYVGTITGGIQGGYGYIVQVQNDATIEICGPAADEDFRPALQSGLNIVGYVPQAAQAVDTYFEDIIATNDLNLVRTVTNGLVQDRIYNVFPFAIGPLSDMMNGQGYLIDVNMAFGEDTWRTVVEYQPTSSFDQFHGYVANGDQLVGEVVEFTDAEGNVFGQATISEGGVFFHAYAYGDLKNTDLVEGFKPEQEMFVSFQDELFPTGMTFNGGWESRRLDLDFGQLVSSVEDEVAAVTSINVYPNPTQGMVKLDINLDRAEGNAFIEVINPLGQVVYSQPISGLVAGEQSFNLDLGRLASGAYHVRVYTNERLIGNRQLIRR